MLLDFVFPPVCLGCGLLLQRGGAWLCTRCGATTRAWPPELRHAGGVEAVLPYEGAWAHALHQLKYHGQLAFAGPLGRLLRQAVALQGGWDAIVPVPLHWRRLWHRGFNQVAVLLDAAARGGPPLPPRRGVLARVRAGPAQASLAARARRSAAARAFVVPARWRPFVESRRLLLVDDVVTTGSTLGAARSALLGAGAVEVGSLALMRTPPS